MRVASHLLHTSHILFMQVLLNSKSGVHAVYSVHGHHLGWRIQQFRKEYETIVLARASAAF